jgi:cytidylate kinase
MARTWILPVAAGAAAAVAIYVVLKRMRRVNYDVLQAEDSTTTACIISAFESDPTFQALAKAETAGILKRDAEDDEKLAAGIKMAVGKGVLDASPPVEPLTTIDVLGKSADAVAGKIISKLGDAPQKGCVFILQGLSGTGKGTTVAKLQSTLPKAVSWSNGNVFRSLTLLAVTKCEKSGTAFSEAALTPTLLGECMTYLKFGKFKDGKFDIKIEGLGLDLLVSEVANTTLKEPKVGKNIPTVAKMTQGEVIKFAAGAAEQMRADGFNVLMEGRAQTLDYVRTPHRFELTLSEPNIIGMRRAAQRMMGEALKQLRSESPPPTPDRVHAVLATALAEMAK